MTNTVRVAEWRKTLSMMPVLLLVGFVPDVMAQSSMLDEVIVTAQKREQSVQDVGIAITAFSADQWQQLGVTNTLDIAAFTARCLPVR